MILKEDDEVADEEHLKGTQKVPEMQPFQSFTPQQLRTIAHQFLALADQKEHSQNEPKNANYKSEKQPAPTVELNPGMKTKFLIVLQSLYFENFFTYKGLRQDYIFQAIADYFGKCLGTSLKYSYQSIYNAYFRRNPAQIFDDLKQAFIKGREGK